MPVALTQTSNPELDQLTVKMLDTGLEISRWLEYSYNENFLTPSDGWDFKIDGDTLSSQAKAALYVGAKVQISLNGHPQSTGYLDVVDPQNSHDGGTVITLSGRDILGPLVMGGADPSHQFSESQTLADILRILAADFGLSLIVEDDQANRNIITGALRAVKSSRRRGTPLRSAQVHQLHPYPGETAYAFMSRLTQRFGLWIWPSADGTSLIVAEPDFVQDPLGRLQRRIGGSGFFADGTSNNILSGGVRLDGGEQPAVILASGVGGGGEFPQATLRGALINPIVFADISAIQARWPSIVFKTMFPAPSFGPFIQDKRPVAIYLHDDESKTQDQLERFIEREMALRLRKAATGKFLFEGHTLAGNPVAVNTVIDVQDDRSSWHAPMWVLGRTLTKKPHAEGSRTSVDLIPLYTLTF